MGDANPSGPLSMTFPRSIGQIPINHDKLTSARPYCGVAPFTKRYVDEAITSLFPFGYGLSHTAFALSDPCVSYAALTADGPVSARVTVTNTGSVPGETVVQLYARMKHLHFARRKRASSPGSASPSFPAKAPRWISLSPWTCCASTIRRASPCR